MTFTAGGPGGAFRSSAVGRDQLKLRNTITKIRVTKIDKVFADQN